MMQALHGAKNVPVTIKTPAEIAKMRVAGRLAADVLDMISEYVAPGVTTGELNERCHRYITQHQQATPAPLHYQGFPKSICTSVNHQVCHGIPGDRVLRSGDILNIDVTIIKDGYHGDTSKMFLLGNTRPFCNRLVDVAQQALWIGIRQVRPGLQLGDLGYCIQRYVEQHRFSVVRDYCGHGIGRCFHEDPQVLHYGKPGTGMTLQPGMTFTIEPMVNAGKPAIRVLPDQWTVVTKDRKLSAQWEHTILCTEVGYEVLTLRAEEQALAEQA